MRFCLLLTSFLVRAHRESQHFAVQLDEEIEEPPPTIVASPENVSNVLGTLDVQPVRVHLLAGVYPNVTFTMRRGAPLELQGEPGTKVEFLAAHIELEELEKKTRCDHELMLKSLQLSHGSFQGSCLVLTLTDVAVEAVHHTGGSISDSPPTVALSCKTCLRSVTIQRSVLSPMNLGFCGANVTIVDSAIMVQAPRATGHGPDVNANLGLITVVNSTLANSSLYAQQGMVIVNSSMIGKYSLMIDGGSQTRIEKSHFGACHGYCLMAYASTTEETYLTVVGSSMQTATSWRGIGLHVEIRDTEVFDVHAPFIDYFPDSDSVSEGGPLALDLTFSMVKFRKVWSAVHIEADHWKVAMHDVTMEEVTLAGLSLQSRDESRRGIVQLRNVYMSSVLGVGVVMDQTIGDISGMTCRECNVGIVARGSSLNISGVDLVGKHKQSNGIVLNSAHLEANDVRMTNLAAGLLLKSSTVHLEDAFITDNALGVLPVNTTGTINGLVYFNDAADELCEAHNGNRICPNVEHQSVAMQVHHAKALMLSLLACLVATISAVQGLKLLYTEKALSLRMVLWMLGCSLWPVVMIGALNVLLVIWHAVQEQEGKQRPNMEFISPEKKMMVRLAVLLLWSAGGMLYVFFDVFLHRHGLMLSGDAKRRKELDEKKAQLKDRLDNKSLRRRMQSMHQELFAALDDRNKADSKRIFQEMKDLAEEEAKNLGGWFEDQRKVYQDEDAGARMQKLEQIASQDGEAVQPPLKDHYCEKEEAETKEAVEVKKSAVDALWTYASWLRRDFKGQLGQLLADLNKFSAKDVREFDEKLQLDPSMHRLQHEDGAEVGPHLGLLVASIKSKERALAKINTDYQEDFKAGKKKEEPLARYVCDFLRATIYAADPFALALAFHEFKKRFKIVRVKNKFANEKLKTEERTNILVNFWVESGDMKQIGEVQFLMQEYLTAKSIQHMYYDVARAKSEDELFDKPIFA
ncbi:unnamed protein product [Symbiodinium sp. CCMP2592]|nr:unnamed protein product [Symbiodinium sp. CCMP2592]